MSLLAQTDPAAVKAVLDELLKHPPQNDTQYAMYVFVVALLIIGGGGFYVLRYMLIHTREIHDTANKTITNLSECFSEECKAAREQHHKDQVMARDNVHDLRDVALTCVSTREFNEDLKKKQDARRPSSGTA